MFVISKPEKIVQTSFQEMTGQTPLYRCVIFDPDKGAGDVFRVVIFRAKDENVKLGLKDMLAWLKIPHLFDATNIDW